MITDLKREGINPIKKRYSHIAQRYYDFPFLLTGKKNRNA